MCPKKYKRPSWDEYFMQVARLISSRSTCIRRKVGAVIVLDKRILSTGYNGAPSKLAHCLDIGCLREKMNVPSGKQHEICRGIHAEQNAILQASRYGIPIAGAKIYITNQPCVLCAKMLINTGISEIIYEGTYPDKMAKDILSEADIKVTRYNNENEKSEKV